jgi:hypothetical protein
VLRLLALLALVLALAGCGGDERSLDGECSARIAWDDVVYRPHDQLEPRLRPSAALGAGRVVDCDGSTVGDPVTVRAVEGFDPGVVLAVVGGGYAGFYVAEELPVQHWPDGLRRTPAPPAASAR